MSAIFYVFLLLVAFAAVCVYLGFFFREVPGAADQRLGRLEPLPDDLGQWIEDSDTPDADRARRDGLRRETRLLYEPSNSLFRSDRFVRQVRYRSLATNEIVKVEPDVVLPRRRVRT